MDVSYDLAENVASTKFDDLPKKTVEITKNSIIDILSCILASSTQAPECQEVVEIVREGGGKKESTILVFSDRIPCHMAALANGAMAHALDYDDVVDETGVHPSTTTVPPAFALAERLGNVDGKKFITAVAVGNDLVCRLGACLAPEKFEFRPATTLGIFSAVGTSGSMLGLDQEKIVDAMGIAFHCGASGTFEAFYSPGATIRGLYGGTISWLGVMSALMAQRGIAGIKSSLEGKAGLFNLYFGGKYSRETLVSELGKKFRGEDVCFKPWPTTRTTHAHIEAALALSKEYNLDPENITEITASVAGLTRGFCEPLEARQRPKTSLDAKASLPFMIATSIARRKVTISDLTPQAITDPVSLRLAKKVTHKFDPKLETGAKVPPGILEIKTKGGKVYSKQVNFALGHPRNPVNWETLAVKFRDCASYSKINIPEKDIDKVLQLVRNLEELEDVSQIIRLLSTDQARDKL